MSTKILEEKPKQEKAEPQIKGPEIIILDDGSPEFKKLREEIVATKIIIVNHLPDKKELEKEKKKEYKFPQEELLEYLKGLKEKNEITKLYLHYTADDYNENLQLQRQIDITRAEYFDKGLRIIQSYMNHERKRFRK